MTTTENTTTERTTMSTTTPVVDDQVAKAVAHPIRRRILEAAAGGLEVSPRDLAEELELKLGDVGYHVRMLREYGALDRVRTEQRRGAVKNYLRITDTGRRALAAAAAGAGIDPVDMAVRALEHIDGGNIDAARNVLLEALGGGTR